MTRGIQAARLALAGASWADIAPLFLGEMLIGLFYTVIGYTSLRHTEWISIKNGVLDILNL